MNEFYGNQNSQNDQNVQNEGFYSKSGQDIVQDGSNTGGAAPGYSQPVNNTAPNYTAPNYTAPNYTAPGYGAPVYNTAPAPKKERRRYGIGVILVAAILAAVIGAGTAFGVLAGSSFLSGGDSKSGNASYSSVGSNDNTNVNISVEETVSSIAEAVSKKCSKSVVGIRTITSVRNFFGGSQEQKGEGSGVVYTADGYIITNYHVIEDVVESGSGKIEVYVGSLDSKSYSATVVGYHISSDLAVLKIDASGLTPLEFADSDKLKVGQYAVTIGAPGGLEFMGSVTYGVISGLNRIVSANQSVPLIQTDAAINPGNSGGALLNSEGVLIGINSSKIVSEEFEGMGFAIPANVVKEKVEKIINKKDGDEPYIGISISEKYTANVLKFYGYPVGAVVVRVDDGSPAQAAGIARGDIITKFNGTAVTEYNILTELINDCEPGETVDVEIYRNGATHTVKVQIGSNSN